MTATYLSRTHLAGFFSLNHGRSTSGTSTSFHLIPCKTCDLRIISNGNFDNYARINLINIMNIFETNFVRIYFFTLLIMKKEKKEFVSLLLKNHYFFLCH